MAGRHERKVSEDTTSDNLTNTEAVVSLGASSEVQSSARRIPRHQKAVSPEAEAEENALLADIKANVAKAAAEKERAVARAKHAKAVIPEIEPLVTEDSAAETSSSTSDKGQSAVKPAAVRPVAKSAAKHAAAKIESEPAQAPAKDTRVASTKAEPTKATPIKAASAKAEPARTTAKKDPAQTEPAKTSTVKAEPAKKAPAKKVATKSSPAKPASDTAEPAKTASSAQAQSAKAASATTVSAKAESAKASSTKAAPAQGNVAEKEAAKAASPKSAATKDDVANTNATTVSTDKTASKAASGASAQSKDAKEQVASESAKPADSASSATKTKTASSSASKKTSAKASSAKAKSSAKQETKSDRAEEPQTTETSASAKKSNASPASKTDAKNSTTAKTAGKKEEPEAKAASAASKIEPEDAHVDEAQSHKASFDTKKEPLDAIDANDSTDAASYDELAAAEEPQKTSKPLSFFTKASERVSQVLSHDSAPQDEAAALNADDQEYADPQDAQTKEVSRTKEVFDVATLVEKLKVPGSVVGPYPSLFKRIFLSLAILSAVTSVLVVILAANIYQSTAVDELSSMLENECTLVKSVVRGDSQDVMRLANLQFGDIRLTYISDEGEVLYDNQNNIESLPNLLDSPEVAQAIDEGAGASESQAENSDTTYIYRAVRLDNGSILRLGAEKSGTVSAILHQNFLVLLVAIAAILVSWILARFISAKLMDPIFDLELEDDSLPIYDEIAPYVVRGLPQDTYVEDQYPYSDFDTNNHSFR